MRIIRRAISTVVTLGVATAMVGHARAEENLDLTPPDVAGENSREVIPTVNGSTPEEEALGTTMTGVAAFIGMILAAGVGGYAIGLVGNALREAGVITYQ